MTDPRGRVLRENPPSVPDLSKSLSLGNEASGVGYTADDPGGHGFWARRSGTTRNTT